MDWDADNADLLRDDATATGYVFTRAGEGHPHRGRKRRGADDPGFAEHPAIVRGLALFAGANTGGAAAQTLFSRPNLSVSYAWFKSGFPLPLHSHDQDCYYLVIAGSMQVGSETLGKGDGVFIPGGAPYTVKPDVAGVEFLEIRTSPDYDTHYRGKTDAYWDRIAVIRQDGKARWAEESQPYRLIPIPGAEPMG